MITTGCGMFYLLVDEELSEEYFLGMNNIFFPSVATIDCLTTICMNHTG